MPNYQVTEGNHLIVNTPVAGAEAGENVPAKVRYKGDPALVDLVHRLHGPGDVLPDWYLDQDHGLAKRIEDRVVRSTNAPPTPGLPPRPERAPARDPNAPPPATAVVKHSGLSPTGGNLHAISIELPTTVEWDGAASLSRVHLAAVVDQFKRESKDLARVRELGPKANTARLNLRKFDAGVNLAIAHRDASRTQLSRVDICSPDAVEQTAALNKTIAEQDAAVAAAQSVRDRCAKSLAEIEGELDPLIVSVRGTLHLAVMNARRDDGARAEHKAACEAIAAAIAKKFKKELGDLAVRFAALDSVPRHDERYAIDEANKLVTSALSGRDK